MKPLLPNFCHYSQVESASVILRQMLRQKPMPNMASIIHATSGIIF